jgi:hypothetical protein
MEKTKSNGKDLTFLIYNTPVEDVSVSVVLEDENIWISQKGMAALFEVQIPAISKHLKNIFDEGELQENSVISILETTASDGKKYKQ